MSVWKKRLSLFAAAALITGATVGCGGGLTSLPGTTPTPVSVDGGVATSEGVVSSAIVGGSAPQSALITVNGVQTQVSFAAGISVGAGESVAIIPDDTTFITGLQGGARSPGDILVNGQPSGAKVINGHIHPALGFPHGRYTLTAEGPFTIRQGSSVLTMQTVSFTFDSNGHVLSLPTSIHGTIPANGSDNWKNSVTAGFNATYGAGSASLTITHSNGTLSRTVALDQSRTATFTDFRNDPQSQIPQQGVDVVSFTHVGTTTP